MEFECIICEQEERIATIKLNRPKVLNAMNQHMWLEMKAAFEDIKSDPDVKVVIITGAGNAFSTGADLKESKNRSPEDHREYLVELQETFRQIIRFEKPTIAAINGYALGSGCELALACDIRLAAEESQIGTPQAKVSSSVSGGAMRLIQNLIGPAKTRELLFTGEYIDGRQAERIGLVNRAVPLKRLMDESRKMATKIAANSAFSIKMIKKGLLMARGEASLEALMDYEIEAWLACASAKKRKEAMGGFESRKKR